MSLGNRNSAIYFGLRLGYLARLACWLGCCQTLASWGSDIPSDRMFRLRACYSSKHTSICNAHVMWDMDFFLMCVIPSSIMAACHEINSDVYYFYSR